MQTHKKLKARILSLALSAAMIATMLPATALAVEGDVPLDASSIGTIQSFETFGERFQPSTGEGASEAVYALNVALNTPFEGLNLPGELTAMVARTTMDEETTVTTVEQEIISVTWHSDKEYVFDENGRFIYTAVLPEGYILADGVELPQIYVAVGKQARDGITQRTTQLSIDEDTATEDKLTTEGWKWDKTTATLTLKNANFNVSNASAISFRIAATVVMEGTNTITATGIEALYGSMAVTIDMVAGSNTTISSNQDTVFIKGLTVQGDGELSVVTSSSLVNTAIKSPSHAVVMKGNSVVHAESTGTSSSAFNMKDLTIEDDAVFTAKVPTEHTRSGTITGSLTATGKVITCNIGNATDYTSSACFFSSTFYEGTTYSDTSVMAGDIKIANAAATSPITVTINGVSYTGSTLQDAISKLAGGAAAVTSLSITAGEVTTADWNYLKNLTALETFEIADTIADGKVANIPDGTYKISIFQPSIETVTVPQAITIGLYVLKGCTNLREATFPAATSIGSNAFYGCTALESITFPAGESIGSMAFENCNALTTVTLPAVSSIGDSAFYGCSNLATLRLGTTPPTIGASVFSGCPATRALGYVDADENDLTGTALTNAQAAYKAVVGTDSNTTDDLWYGWTIGAAVVTSAITVSINGAAYEGGTLQEAISKLPSGAAAVTSLSITAGEVTTDDWKYLKSLDALTSVEIANDPAVTAVADIPGGTSTASIFPASIVTVTVPQAIAIGDHAFIGCAALTDISFPAATSIGSFVFTDCASITSVDFPAVTSIGESVFKGCSLLTTANFPAVTSIGESGFIACAALTTVNVPAVTSIGSFAFFNCSAFATLKLGATPPTTVGNNAFLNCPGTRALGYVDADGNDLTGDALAAAITAYKAATGTTGGKWHGWTIEVVAAQAVAFDTLTANGAANTTTTTELTLGFDKDVTGLAAADITVTGATKGTLTKVDGQTGQYKLAISAITVAEGANVNVAVAKTGFTFNPANKDVAVHKATGKTRTHTLNVSIDDILDKDGNVLTPTNGVYDMLATEGWKWEATTKVLTLNGADIDGGSFGGILAPSDTTITLFGDNSVVSGDSNAIQMIGTSGGLTIGGTGSLDVTGKYSAIGSGIDNTSTANITITGGTIRAIGDASHVIWANGGGLTISGAADVTATGTTLCALRAVSGIAISGSATVSAITTSTSANAVYTEGTINISDTADVTATSTSYCGLNAGGGITVTGGAVTASSDADVAVFSPANITISGTAQVTATGAINGIKANGILTISGGTVTATGAPAVRAGTLTLTGMAAKYNVGSDSYTGATNIADNKIYEGTTQTTEATDVKVIALVPYTGTQAAAPNSTPASKTDTQIVLAVVTVTGETVEYALSTSSTAPTSDADWQTGTTFTGLTADTQYYFFARVKANDTHMAGTISAGAAIKTDLSDAQKIAAAKTLAQTTLTNMTATNATTADAVLGAINTALAGTGVTVVWDAAGAFQKVEATNSAAGSITGAIKLTCGDASDTVSVDLAIAQLGSDTETLAEAKTAAVAALGSYTATNATTEADVLALVNNAITDAGILGITSSWSVAFSKTDATTSAPGRVTGTITLTLNGVTTDVAVDLSIAQLSTYTVTVSDGGTGATASGASYAAGDTVSISAGTKSGYTFNGWTASPSVVFASTGSASTSFVMPASNVTVTAHWSSSGSGGSFYPGNPGSSVTVDGKPENIGKVESTTSTTTVVVDSAKLDSKVSAAKDGSSVVIPVSTSKDSAAARLVVESVEKMAAKDMTLEVTAGKTTYVLPAAAIDTSSVLAQLGATDAAKVPFTVTITNEKNVKVEGATVVGTPVSFTVSASYGGKTVTVDHFDTMVTRTMEMTKEQAARVTTAVVVDANGAVRHVPTYVYQSGNKWYAKVNSMTNSTYALIESKSALTDLDGQWYANAANELSARKVTDGVFPAAFDGGKDITRAEFAALLVNGLGLPKTARADFSDVAADAWYTGHVATAVEYGIVKGIGGGKFAPDATITRQEAMVMLSRAAQVMGYAGKSGELTGFSDVADVGAWAMDGAKFSVGSGLIVGNDGKLMPLDNITRGETATVVLRLLQQAGLVDVRTEA